MATVTYNPNTPAVCTLLVSSLYNKFISNFALAAKNGNAENSNILQFGSINLVSDTAVNENECVLSFNKNSLNSRVSFPPSNTNQQKKVNNNPDNNNILCSTDIIIARQLALSTNSVLHLYGNFSCSINIGNMLIKRDTSLRQSLNPCCISAEIDFWVDFSKNNFSSYLKYMAILNKHLRLKTYFVDRRLSLADICIFVKLNKDIHTSKYMSSFSVNSPPPPFPETLWKYFSHVGRWYEFIREILYSNERRDVKDETQLKDSRSGKQTNISYSKDKYAGQGGSYENKLPGAEMGKVVVRFPPEPSGYLHIGHAKAAMLNNYFAKLYHGKLIVRFDDTNPAKESMEFESSIMEDLKMLDVQPHQITHTSDYFDTLIQFGEKFIKDGNAYVDDTPLEVMRDERMKSIESKCRNQDVQTNLKMWNEMIKGSALGVTYCMRAKIDMNDKNGSMRDPVLFRCIVDIPHHHFQFKYKTYPTYDFACPIVDSLEGVTHAMRTNEYCDRIPQYKWVIEKAGLRDVCIYEFSRLNFVRTVLSKRRLTWFVQQKIVEGWDDPRFPTVRGIIRRGLKVEALLKFLLEQGPSKSINLMEWDKLWTINKQIIDPVIKRYSAVDVESIVLVIKDGPKDMIKEERFFHNKNESLGKTLFAKFHEILIEKDDANLCEEGEEIGLMRWSCVVIDKIIYDENDKKVKRMEGHLNLNGQIKNAKKKLHWLANHPENLARVVLREYDHLLNVDKPDATEENFDFTSFVNKQSVFDSRAFADVEILKLDIGETIQLERRGYFRVDKKNEKGNEKMILIKIPDGKSKSMSCISTKVDVSKFGARSEKKGSKK